MLWGLGGSWIQAQDTPDTSKEGHWIWITKSKVIIDSATAMQYIEWGFEKQICINQLDSCLTFKRDEKKFWTLGNLVGHWKQILVGVGLGFILGKL